MSYFRQARFAIDMFHSLTSKIITPSRNLCTRNSFHSVSSSANVTKSSIFHPLDLLNQVRQSGKALRNRKVLIVSGVVICSAFYASRDTVLYTNRSRTILVPVKITYWIGEVGSQKFVQDNKIAPETDPRSVRVKPIMKDIIVGIRKDDVMQNGSASKHFDRLNWEVVVADETETLASAYSNGKIVVSGQVLRDFETDAEIATIIGHEVAHIIARHHAECLTIRLWCSVLRLFTRAICIISPHYSPFWLLDQKVKHLHISYLRLHEIEADHIGMILIASAGYDPQIAPRVYNKLGQLYEDQVDGPLHTHPPAKKRAELLCQVMEEALRIYKKSLAKK